MIANVNQIKFVPSTHYDTVVIGGINAQRLAYAIHAAYYPLKSFEEGLCYGQFVLGSKFKHAIYFPWEDQIYGKSVNFEESLKIMMAICNQIQKFNSVSLIMLPILRKCDETETSKKFQKWFKENSRDLRLVGTKEVDSMQLIHYLQATPLDNKELKYVDKNGLLTEAGVSKLVDYLAALEYDWKIVKSRDPKQHEVPNARFKDPSKTFKRTPSQTQQPFKRSKSHPFQDVMQLKKCFKCGSADHLSKQCARGMEKRS